MRFSLLVRAVWPLAVAAAACSGSAETGDLSGTSTSGAASSTSGASASGGASGTSSGAYASSASSSTGSSGASSTSASSGGTTGGSPDAGAGPCRPDVKTDCAPTEYCKVNACAGMGGVCTKRPPGDNATFEPVCGCDDITYWNARIAAAHGVNVASKGACAQPAALDCKKGTCPGGAKCSYDQGSKLACGGTGSATGTCWMLPPTCNSATASSLVRVRRCTGDTCVSLCQIVTDEAPFYSQSANGCP